jgi:TniQ/Bacterial regulatory helix-turn-helix protein, lysR family
VTGPASPRTLPIRVGVVLGESLDSWLEASCRRLDVTIGVLLAALGLRTHPHELHGLPDYTVLLHPAEAHRLTDATGVEAARLHAMTLRRYDGHVLRCNHDNRTVARSAWWARTRGSRYCPSCLSEQDGRWLLRWRLWWVFACTDHSVLLCDTCPACGRIPRRITTSHGSLRPAGTCPGTADRPCGVDLRTIDPLRLPGDDPLLATQHQINTLLSAVEAGTTAELAATPAVVFGDLRVVGGWLLRHATQADFDHFGAHVHDAWQAYQARAAIWSGAAPPGAAALIGATATQAAALLAGHDQDAIDQLGVLLGRGTNRRKVCPPGMAPQQWRQLSDPVKGRFLRALDPDLGTVDRIRYRSLTPMARVPITGEPPAATRARHIPQQLWPGWTIRLLPTSRLRGDRFRATIAACLLLPGHPTRNLNQITAHLHPYLRRRVATTLRDLHADGHQQVLAAVCQLADYLDHHGSPVDYHRRRATIGPATISQPDWQQLCYQAGAHPGRPRRLLDAQRYLFQLLTGADLNDPSHALAFRSANDRTTYLAFTTSLPMPVRQALTDHAAAHLQRLGIDEPLTWEPPADCCQDLELPGRDPDDIDLDAVHQLVVVDRLPPGAAASKLDTTIDHIRLALERLPQTPQRWAANTPPMAWQRRQHAQHLLTRQFFEREYLAGRKRLAQIAAETGLPKKLVARHAHQAGITLFTGHEATPIDPDWLRQQYLECKRSFTDIAAELGVCEMTVNRAAHRHGIPIRPAGVTSHPEMVRTLDPSIPTDIRRAVEGGLWGWQRLHRFQQAMAFPTIEQAAGHLGAHQSALVKQLQRLERDIGAQLYHRATHTVPLRPTRRGAALLKALDQPAIRALAIQGNAKPMRNSPTPDR